MNSLIKQIDKPSWAVGGKGLIALLLVTLIDETPLKLSCTYNTGFVISFLLLSYFAKSKDMKIHPFLNNHKIILFIYKSIMAFNIYVGIVDVIYIGLCIYDSNVRELKDLFIRQYVFYLYGFLLSLSIFILYYMPFTKKIENKSSNNYEQIFSNLDKEPTSNINNNNNSNNTTKTYDKKKNNKNDNNKRGERDIQI